MEIIKLLFLWIYYWFVMARLRAKLHNERIKLEKLKKQLERDR